MSNLGTHLQPRRWLPALGCLLLLTSTPGSSRPSPRSPLPLSSALGEATWTSLLEPFEREQHTAIYDPVRDRIVLFGGDNGWEWDSDVWVLSLSGTPRWTKLVTAGTPPSPRIMHSAIYDPVRDRMIVFGGSGLYFDQTSRQPAPPGLNDVWALSLSGTPTWSQLVPGGTPPAPRQMHSAIYDPLRDRMLVYGGSNGGPSNYDSDVWALSLSGSPAWTQVVPSGVLPPARCGHTAVYDPARDRMVVFAGMSDAGLVDPESNDVWALSLSGTPAWSNLSPSGTLPDVRVRAAAIYDPVRDQMLVMGGEFIGSSQFGGTFAKSDTWALSFSGAPAWTKLALPALGRTEHAAFYDPVRDRMLVVGGWNIGTHSEVYALALSNPQAWSALTDPQPIDRTNPLAVYDSARQRMVIFGGHFGDWHTDLQDFGSGYQLGDTWALSVSGAPAWTRLSTTGTLPDPNGAAIYDPLRDRMLYFGGRSQTTFSNSVRALDFSGAPAWTLLSTVGTPPTGRRFSSAVYDPVRDRMMIFGGAPTSNTLVNEVWALSLSGVPAWNQLLPSGTPPGARIFHAAVYDPAADRLVIFGGYDGSGLLNDVWALSLSGSPAWSAITPSGSPPAPRDLCSAILDPSRSRMVVFGGNLGSAADDGVWALSLTGAPVWTDLLGTGTPRIARGTHAAIYDPANDRMVSFAGYDNAGATKNDVWALGFGATAGVEIPAAAAFSLLGVRPNPSSGHFSAWFTLPAAGPARLELLDVSGRRLASREVGSLGAGSHSVDLTPQRPLSPGVYLLRLTREGRTATARAAVVR